MRLLDTDRLLTLRLERGLSQRALARKLGVSSPTIARLEEGSGHPAMTLGRLQELADALGAAPADLLLADTPPVACRPTPDDTKVEAALASANVRTRTEVLATGLGWPLERTTQALNQLRKRLHGTGLLLHRSTNGWRLLPATSVLTCGEQAALDRARHSRRGLTMSQLRLLFEIIEGRVDSAWEQRVSNASKVDLSSLLRAGYVVKRKHAYVLTGDVRFSLGLQETPQDGLEHAA